MNSNDKGAKILIVSEAPLCVDAGGIAQTLYNVLSFSKPENLLCITPEIEVKRYPPSAPYKNCCITYRSEYIVLPRNRITAKIQGAISWINYSILFLLPHKRVRDKIKEFRPDVVISCPNGPVGVIMHRKLLHGSAYKILPYFMDDWMYQSKTSWMGGNLNQLVKSMISNNRNWLMIGNELAEVLKERYKVEPQKVLSVRNPVELRDAPSYKPLTSKNIYTIAYAGALWPMHFDSFLLMATAVKKINSAQARIRFIVYTGENYWNWRKKDLELVDVEYGGSIPYNQIHQKLSEADLLLVTSSFSSELYTHAKASVQTKLTDYLKARRLVVSYGPPYSANHHFLQQHDCGICISTGSVDEIVIALGKILSDIASYQYMIDNGWRTLEREFTFEAVHNKLREFIQQG